MVKNAVLNKTKYVWLKNPKNLTKKQLSILGSLRDENLKTVRAYNIRLILQGFWTIRPKDVAEVYLKKRYLRITHSLLDEMTNDAKMIKKHWKGIVNFIESRITNGILSGLNTAFKI